MFKFLAFVNSHTKFFCGCYIQYSPQFSYAKSELRNLFSHSLPVDPNTHTHAAWFWSFILNCVQCSEGWVVCCLVFCRRRRRVLTMGKQKCKFKDKLKSKYLCFKNSLNVWYVNQQLTHLCWTWVLLIFEPTWCARSTRKLLEVKQFSKSNKYFLLNWKGNQTMLY